MQLVIKDGKVHVTHRDGVDILGSYDLSTYEIVDWAGPGNFRPHPATGKMPDDPRSPAQKAQDAQKRHIRRRKSAYPHVQKMLLMIYRDMKNGTTDFVDAIDAIHDQFQPPE
jgi:hypothetical protein